MYIRFRRIWNPIIHFAEHQGFPIIVTICIAIITATAIWRTPSHEDVAAPTPPVNQDISAAQLLQESLRNALTPTPAPTAAPPEWAPPLDVIHVIRPFNPCQFVYSDAAGVWQVHAGVDLAADQGTPVHAMADGEVIAHGKDALRSSWLLISHGEVQALYAGMLITEDYITGDAVDMNDIIGYVGGGLMDERSLGPHLHLEARKDGLLIDPAELWRSN